MVKWPGPHSMRARCVSISAMVNNRYLLKDILFINFLTN